MYIFWMYPTEHKWKPDGELAMIYDSNTMTVSELFNILVKQKQTLGLEVSDAELENMISTDILSLNYCMSFGLVENVEVNKWVY